MDCNSLFSFKVYLCGSFYKFIKKSKADLSFSALPSSLLCTLFFSIISELIHDRIICINISKGMVQIMKIGDFSKKYNMNITTVRYYVERALLTPERKNNQYIFNKSCMDDMEKILKYKSFHFSLEEIELLFFLEKTSKFKDVTVLQIFSELLNQKKLQLEEQQRSLQDVISRLETEIKNFRSINRNTEENPNGIPFTFIPYLCCPKCGTPLNLESVNIAQNKIISGDLLCGCGYKSSIKNGVILCEGYTESTPFKAFENIESVASIADEYGNEYRQLIDKTYMWMYHQIPDSSQHRNIMTGPFSLNFLLKYCQKFSSDTTFIISDPSLKRISKLQDYMRDFDFQTVYIAGKPDALPLCKSCVDVYIDDFSAVNCIFTYNKSPYALLSSFIKKHGTVIGIFADYKKAPQSLEAFKADHPDFITKMMSLNVVKADMESNGMKIVSEKVIGTLSGREKQFMRHVTGESIPIMGYKALK